MTPTIEEMKAWDTEKLLQWILHKRPLLDRVEFLDMFRGQYILGESFVTGSFEFFRTGCGIPGGHSQILNLLREEVFHDQGKFIPWT